MGLRVKEVTTTAFSAEKAVRMGSGSRSPDVLSVPAVSLGLLRAALFVGVVVLGP